MRKGSTFHRDGGIISEGEKDSFSKRLAGSRSSKKKSFIKKTPREKKEDWENRTPPTVIYKKRRQQVEVS